MKAIWLENNKIQFKTALPEPSPKQNEALIKIDLAGICSTDIALIKGYYDFTGIIGHEFVGTVIKAIQAPELIGKRVVGDINMACRQCHFCQSGLSNHCENRKVLGILNHPGVFAEYMTLPVDNLHIIPDSVSNEVAVFIEPLAASLQIQQQINIENSDQVLVIGAGKLGQLIAQSLKTTDCQLAVSARYEHQKQCLEKMGISNQDDIENISGKYDIVIEATGSENGLQQAIQCVKPKGRIVLKSTYANHAKINLSAIVVKEITLIGSRCGPFDKAINLLKNKQVQPQLLIDKIIDFDDALQAIHQAQQKGSLKIILKM